jgi:Tfp pilus assembly protein PilZ
MKYVKKQTAENINISSVTKELISAVMKMSGDEKYLLLRNKSGQKQSVSTFFNPKTITKQAIELITTMSLEEKCKLLGELKTSKGQSRRQFTRQDYVTPVHLVVKGTLINAYTKNISKGGVFIDTSRAYELKFMPGDAITMNFDHPQFKRPIKITGKIVRVTKAGVGVSFDEYL